MTSNVPEFPTGTRVLEATERHVIVALPEGESWHGSDGRSRFLTMTPQVAMDMMHALEWWRDER